MPIQVIGHFVIDLIGDKVRIKKVKWMT